MLKLTTLKELTKKVKISIECTGDNWHDKQYILNNQILFNFTNEDIKSHYNYIQHLTKEKILESENKVNTFFKPSRSLVELKNNLIKNKSGDPCYNTNIQIPFDNTIYTVFKSHKNSNNIIMVNSSYVSLFDNSKDYYSILDNMLIVDNEFFDNIGLIMGYTFINIDGQKKSIKEYISTLL